MAAALLIAEVVEQAARIAVAVVQKLQGRFHILALGGDAEDGGDVVHQRHLFKEGDLLSGGLPHVLHRPPVAARVAVVRSGHHRVVAAEGLVGEHIAGVALGAGHGGELAEGVNHAVLHVLKVDEPLFIEHVEPAQKLSGAVGGGPVDHMAVLLIVAVEGVAAEAVGGKLRHGAEAAHQQAVIHGDGVVKAHGLGAVFLTLKGFEHLGQLVIGGGHLHVQVLQPVHAHKGAHVLGICHLVLDGIDGKELSAVLNLSQQLLIRVDDGPVVGHVRLQLVSQIQNDLLLIGRIYPGGVAGHVHQVRKVSGGQHQVQLVRGRGGIHDGHFHMNAGHILQRRPDLMVLELPSGQIVQHAGLIAEEVGQCLRLIHHGKLRGQGLQHLLKARKVHGGVGLGKVHGLRLRLLRCSRLLARAGRCRSRCLGVFRGGFRCCTGSLLRR